LSAELENKCYPMGIVYIIMVCHYTPEERDELAYKELVMLSKLDGIKTEHLHFCGWEEYRKVRKQVGDKDIFGKLWVKIQ